MPLVLLAIPSVVIGYLTIGPMLFGDFFKDAIVVDAEHHPAMEELAEEFHGPVAMALHALTALPFWLALAGVVVAYVFYMVKPEIPAAIQARFSFVYRAARQQVLLRLVQRERARARRALLGTGLWKGGDEGLIDGVLRQWLGARGRWHRGLTRALQTGYLYWYALVMIVGVIGLMTWQLWPFLGALLSR